MDNFNPYPEYKCDACDRIFTSSRGLKTHQLSHTKKLYKCVRPPSPRLDVSVRPIQTGGALDLLDVEELYRRNSPAISTYHRPGKFLDILNFEVGTSINDIRAPSLKAYSDTVTTRVKANVSFGFILRHRTTDQLRYFHSSVNNSSLFDKPITVGRLSEFERFIDTIIQTDLMAWIQQRRPNTSWVVHKLTNVSIYLCKMLGTSLIGQSVPLPLFLTRSKSVLTLTHNYKTGAPFTDRLCFFRALSLVLACPCKTRCRCKFASERHTKRLLQKWNHHQLTSYKPSSFPGVAIEDLVSLEKVFDVSIVVYTLVDDKVGSLFWRTQTPHPKTLKLCLHENHFCLIKHIANFTDNHQCKQCGQRFTRSYSVKRHNCRGLKTSLTPTLPNTMSVTAFTIPISASTTTILYHNNIFYAFFSQ